MLYAGPSNKTPAGEELEALVAERVEKAPCGQSGYGGGSHTGGSGHLFRQRLGSAHLPAAAEYQVARLAKANDRTEEEIRAIIKQCTDGKFLGIFGEETVNVLEFNLRLDGILK